MYLVFTNVNQIKTKTGPVAYQQIGEKKAYRCSNYFTPSYLTLEVASVWFTEAGNREAIQIPLP